MKSFIFLLVTSRAIKKMIQKPPIRLLPSHGGITEKMGGEKLVGSGKVTCLGEQLSTWQILIIPSGFYKLELRSCEEKTALPNTLLTLTYVEFSTLMCTLLTLFLLPQ